MRRILLAAPVRDRGWVLPAYLDRVNALILPEDVRLDCFFLLNGPDPQGCGPMLERFKELVSPRMHVEVATWPEEPPAPPTRENANRLNIYGYLARLRNETIERALSGGYDYLFSVDCDLMLPEDTLVRLLADDRDVVAGRVCNDEFWPLPSGLRVHNLLRRAPFPGPEGSTAYTHVRSLPESGLIDVDVTGAGFLIRRAVLEAGCRFAHHPMGEDVPFCEQAQAAGFRLYGDVGVRLDHIMGQHAWVQPQVLQSMPHNVPFFVQIPAGDRTRLDVLLSPATTKVLTERIWARLLVDEMRAQGHALLNGMSEVERFDWDHASNAILLRLAGPAPAAEPVQAQPVPSPAQRTHARHPKRKGMVAPGKRR